MTTRFASPSMNDHERQHGRGEKSKFTLSEDALLKSLVARYGEKSWCTISSFIPNRNERQCHDRWTYYLSPNVNKLPWTEEEEARLVSLVNTIGPHWVKIAKEFKGRTDIQIKNKWNVIKRRVKQDVPIDCPQELFSSPEQSAPLFNCMHVIEQAKAAESHYPQQVQTNEKKIADKDDTFIPCSYDSFQTELDGDLFTDSPFDLDFF